MSSHRNSLLFLHAAVLLFGVAELFGKWIAADPVEIGFGRTPSRPWRSSLTFGGAMALAAVPWVSVYITSAQRGT